MLIYGLVIGAVGLVAAQALKRPPADWIAEHGPATTAMSDTSPTAMLKTPVFWRMFLMMTMMSTSGLMVTALLAFFVLRPMRAGSLHRRADASRRRPCALRRFRRMVWEVKGGPGNGGRASLVWRIF